MSRWRSVLLASFLATAASASSRRAQEAYTSEACGISFKHPPHSIVRRSMIDPDPCALLVQPSTLDSPLVASDSVDVYTLDLWVLPMGFVRLEGGTDGTFELVLSTLVLLP